MAEYVVTVEMSRGIDGDWLWPKIDVSGPDLSEESYEALSEIYGALGLQLLQIAKRRRWSPARPRAGSEPRALQSLGLVETPVAWAQISLGLDPGTL